jgi:hypothetical protein
MTKELFIEAYDKYPPSWISKIVFKYFSQSTEKKNSTVKRSITWILISFFAIGFIATILKLGKTFISFFALSYCILLAILVLFLFAGVILNNLRVKKIAKELNISIKEYNNYVDLYL